MKNNAPDKVLIWVIVGHSPVDQNGRENVRKGVDVDTVKVIDTVERASISGITKIWYVSFGKEVNDVRSGINGWCAGDTDGIRNVGTPDVRLQERGMYLSRVDEHAGLCVQRAYPILRRGEKDELRASSKRCVYQRLGVKLLTPPNDY